MTEIEIETYSSGSYSEEDVEYSFDLITPDDAMDQNTNKKNKPIFVNTSFSAEQSESEYLYNSIQYDHLSQKENSNFSQFLKRQIAANKRQVKIRDNPPNERQFNPPPFKYKLKSAVPPPKAESSSINKCGSKPNSSLFERSIHQPSHLSNSHYSFKRNDDTSYFSSYDVNDEFNFKLTSKKQQKISDNSKKFRCDLITLNSELIANEKNNSIINNTCGNQDIITLFQLKQILRRFFIKDEQLVSEICLITKIKNSSELINTSFQKQKSIFDNRVDRITEQSLYDNQILKRLLNHSITEESIKNLSDIEIKIRNCISAYLRNDKYLSKKEKI